MSISTTTTMSCDECGKAIKDEDDYSEVVLREFVTPEVPEGAAPAPRAQQTDVTLHYHAGCFDRQKALQASTVDKAAGRA